MTLAPSSDNIMLGKGELFFDEFDFSTGVGVSTGYKHLGNCQRFAIILNDDVVTLNTSQDASAGPLKRVTRRREINVEVGSNEFGAENLAIALMGSKSTFTQASSNVTGEILTTSVVKGRWYKTAGRNLSGVVITQGTATWTVSTDYTVYDSDSGLIQVKATTGAAVTTATPATIAYTRASLSLDQVVGATKTKLEGKLLFVPDPTTGPQYDVEIWHVAVTPAGEVGLITEDFGEYQLNMLALDDSGGSYGGSASQPYFRKIQRGTA